jgi:hypothetical protein
MAAAKKKSVPESSARFPKIASLFSGWGKYVLLGVLLAGGLGFAGYKIWQFVHDKTLASEEFQLTAEKILLKPWPMPRYVRPDPRVEVFAHLQRSGPVSIMDRNLSERITAAFQQNPWIAKVHKVTKKYPASVEVELDYRQPVMMVQIGLEAYAVDSEGTSLPTKGCFNSPLEIAEYPRLIGVDKGPAVGEGKRWGDSRVIGGAEIAAALLPVWKKLHLQWIIPRAISLGTSSELNSSPQFGEYQFEIIAPGPRDAKGIPGEIHIYWGKSPTDKKSQDFTPAQKVKKLEDIASEKGSSDNWPKEIDLNRP